jgi:signal transduction histidine kinase/CheY-like chemotaxis protein
MEPVDKALVPETHGDGRTDLFLKRRSAGWSYLVAVLGAGAVMAACAVSRGVVGTLFATAVFLLAVLAAGMIGGWKPGVLTTGLCTAGVLYFFTAPYYTFRVSKMGDQVRLLAYAAAGLAISLLCEGLRRAWERIEERQRQLELEICERTRAEEQLREADRRKDEFLATLAHELRNPLAPLSNALQLWSYVEHDAAETANLRTLMKRQVDQMTRLIDDLLDVSRVARGKIQLRKTRVDLATVLCEAIDSHKSLAAVGGHALTFERPQERFSTLADELRLSQVFGNVLHNAIKFTPTGGLISVTLEREGANAVIRVRDSGCGIPQTMLTRIFECFQQVDQSLGRAHGGLGIGLNLARRLVELHSGTIVARSDGPGKGSEFVITLPVSSTNEVSSGAPEKKSTGTQRDSSPSRRILVVDDARASAETLATLLRAIGHDVATANDGRSAIEWTHHHKPDFVFLDIAMPEMDGYEVARRIRDTASLDEIVLVALTGYGQEDDRRRAREAGFNYHLTKPTSLSALKDILGRRGNLLSGDSCAVQAIGKDRSGS